MRHLHPVGFPNGLAVHNSLDLYTQLPAILDQLEAGRPRQPTKRLLQRRPYDEHRWARTVTHRA